MSEASIATVGTHRVARVGGLVLVTLLLAAGAHGAPLVTPSGVTLTVRGDRPTLRAEPFGYTIDVPAELTNNSDVTVHVLAALAAERDDLVVEMNNTRQVCGHHFLWWDWDCFTYCNLATDPQYLTPICVDDLRIAPAMGTPEPTPVAEATPPADVVLGVVATTDAEKVATALKLGPGTEVGAPALGPGDTWHLLLRVHIESAPGAAPPGFAVTVADDAGFATQVLPLQLSDCAPPPPGMVAWWPLDEPAGATAIHDIAPAPDSAADNVGALQPAGQVGFPNGPDAVAGEVGGALFFSGTGDIVQVPDDPELNFGKLDFSIDAWISPLQLGPTIIQPIVEKMARPVPPGSPPRGLGYSFYVEGQRLHAAIGDGGPLAIVVSDPAAIIPFAPAWTHVAVTVDRAAGVVTFYVNGVAVPAQAPPALPAGSSTTAAPLGIGHSSLPADGLGEISIDELEIFRRVLSAAEIHAIYDAGAKGKCRQACAGDCDGSGDVSINELIILVNIALGTLPASTCAAGDTNHDGTITIAELIAAVNNALNGCTMPPTFTPTPSATPARTETPPSPPTSTATATPRLTATATTMATATSTATATPTATATASATRTPVPPSEICGFKFEDLNGDGMYQPQSGEHGVPGWTITLTFGNPVIDLETTTDAQGQFCFTGLAPGTYHLFETMQAGWMQTFPPSAGSYSASVPPSRTTLVFGNQRIPTVTPTATFTATATVTGTATPCCRSEVTLNLATGQAPMGQNDPQWRLVSAPVGTTGGVGPHPAVVITANGAWTVQNGTQWASANSQCTDTTAAQCPGGHYVYELCWSQCGQLSNSPSVQVLADNSAIVLLNGVQIGATTGGFTTPTLINFADPGPNTANCLRVDVTNNPSSATGGSATGIDVTGSLTGCIGLFMPTATPTPKVPPPD